MEKIKAAARAPTWLGRVERRERGSRFREAVTTLEDAERIARRVLGGAHPTTGLIEQHLEEARFTLAAIDAP